MPSSKSSSQLSVCSSGCRRTAGIGRASGGAFFVAAGGTIFLAPDEMGNTFNDDARAAGELDSLNRSLTGEVGNSCRATSRCSRPLCFEGREGARCKGTQKCYRIRRKRCRLTSERLVPLLHLEDGLVKVIIAQRTRPLDLSFRRLPVGHLLFRGEHPWMT
jgi:hypothetical protein